MISPSLSYGLPPFLRLCRPMSGNGYAFPSSCQLTMEATPPVWRRSLQIFQCRRKGTAFPLIGRHSRKTVLAGRAKASGRKAAKRQARRTSPSGSSPVSLSLTSPVVFSVDIRPTIGRSTAVLIAAPRSRTPRKNAVSPASSNSE